MSIPWSPPEFFSDPPRADVRSDVFSLAASVYSLLAGRTPFERRGQRNTATDLIQRIVGEPLPPLDRPDIPPELNRALSIAMAKDPAGRYDTALALGRALQQVELSLSLPVTQMDVLDEWGAAGHAYGEEDDELVEHTRIRKVATVDPETGTAPGGRRPDPYAGVAPALEADPSSAAPGWSGASAPSAPSAADSPESTMLRPAGTASRTTGQEPSRRPRRRRSRRRLAPRLAVRDPRRGARDRARCERPWPCVTSSWRSPRDRGQRGERAGAQGDPPGAPRARAARPRARRRAPNRPDGCR